LNIALAKYEINTPMRVAMFIANVGEESGQLNNTHELWGPTYQQTLYERDLTKPWRSGLLKTDRNYVAYNLGNSEVGDGFHKRGHGLLQTTGRNNLIALSKVFGQDFVNHPELLEGGVWASESAGYYWRNAGCNQMADKMDFDGSCDLINIGRKTITVGDSIGFANRLAYFNKAKEILGIK
jgi:putative chitinase